MVDFFKFYEKRDKDFSNIFFLNFVYCLKVGKVKKSLKPEFDKLNAMYKIY